MLNFTPRALIMATISGLILISSPALPAGRKILHHHCPTQSYEGKLVIDVLSVGQGDSTFIRTPSGTTVLIDGGNPGRGTHDVLPTLKKCYGVTSLDYVVLTHPHADHFGGLIDVLRRLPIKKAVVDGGHGEGKAYARYEKLANETGKRKLPELGTTAIVDGGSQAIASPGKGTANALPTVSFNIVAVNGTVAGGESVPVFKKDGSPKDKNSVSIAMVISHGGFRYFTGGDLSGGGRKTPDVESILAQSFSAPSAGVDIMKADHHGSATANNQRLLTRLHPHQVLISVGDGEDNIHFHLPNSVTMARLESQPGLDGVFLTAHGEGKVPLENFKKAHNESGDIVVVIGTGSYFINEREFKMSQKN